VQYIDDKLSAVALDSALAFTRWRFLFPRNRFE